MPAQGLYDPRHEHDACGVGFVVDLAGRKSHTIVAQALTVLKNLLHRGACGCEPNTGDGAGILMQMPDRFLRRECARLEIPLPAAGEYGCGLVFLPRKTAQRRRVQALLHSVVEHEGQQLLGWRDVPTDDGLLGETARSVEPVIKQVFVGRGADVRDRPHFERKLYIIRKLFEKAIAAADVREQTFAYLPSLSCNTLIYKGMLSADQIESMYPDVTDPDVESALALVHQRFSTNTFPSWPLAHPYRYVAHNGEINTLRGNINWMRAREALCRSSVFGDELWKVLPVTRDGLSDSATFDNVLEFLVMSGRSLPHAILMMIPEPWQKHESMSPARRAFYEYHSALMEPWDGPASIAFTDGTVIGAILDRNGLRPSRYYVTRDGLVVMASEVGVLDIPPENVLIKERLHPGRRRAGSSTTRRSRPSSPPSTPTPTGSARTSSAWTTCPGRARPSPATRRSSSGRSRSGTRTRTSGSCWRRWRSRARKRWGRWAPTRRSRSCRTGHGRSTTTSSSCSPRSRTLPWTRSGRSS
jgi:glutamate synthase (ferredoxin)